MVSIVSCVSFSLILQLLIITTVIDLQRGFFYVPPEERDLGELIGVKMMINGVQVKSNLR